MSETYLVGPLSSFEFETTIGLVHATSLALTISYEYLFLILYYWMELIWFPNLHQGLLYSKNLSIMNIYFIIQWFKPVSKCYNQTLSKVEIHQSLRLFWSEFSLSPNFILPLNSRNRRLCLCIRKWKFYTQNTWNGVKGTKGQFILELSVIFFDGWAFI